MNFQITVEGKKSIAEIRRQFENELSEKQILSSTAKAINTTAKRAQGFLRKEVRSSYTMNRKYLDRMSSISKFAKGTPQGLYAEMSFRYRPIPMIAFKHTGTKGSKNGLSVEVKKGSSFQMRHAFIATMRNVTKKNDLGIVEHEGIFGSGRYVGKKFVYDNTKTASGKQRITEFMTASPFTMSTSKTMQPKINAYVNKNLPQNLRYLLQRKLDRLTKKN